MKSNAAKSIHPIHLILWGVPLLLGTQHARASEVPGFSIESIQAVGDVVLADRLGTAAASTDHIINIDDCGSYTGHSVDVTLRVDVSLGDYYYTLVAAEPDVTCSTSSLETSSEGGCHTLIDNETLDASTLTARVELDLLSGGNCSASTSTTARLHLIAQYTDDTTVIYVSTLEFLVDLQRPAAPVLTSVSSGDAKLAVVWTDADNEGENVTYDVYWEEGVDVSDPSAFSTRAISTLSYDIETEVENGVSYSVGVRAVDAADNESNLSNSVSAAPAPSTDFWEAYLAAGGTDQAGFCFVATAAFGTPMDRDLGTLRRFRDQLLMQSSIGRSFVGGYYQWGRFAAAYIADKPALRFAARVVLTPLIWIASIFLFFGPVGGIAFFGSLFMLLGALRKRVLRLAPPHPRWEGSV